MLVSVPYWRSDIRLKADLAEEVARVLGYDRVPMVTLSGEVPHQKPQPLLNLKERLKDLMVGCGFYEALTYSMVSASSLRKLAPGSAESPSLSGPLALRLANPMSPEQEYLRTSLRPGLLSTLAANQRFEKGGVRLFELGKVYLPRQEGLPEEREMLCAVLSGRRSGSGRWLEGDDNMDFFDLKAVAGAVLTGLGIAESELKPAADATFQPASSAQLCTEGTPLGVLGEVDRRVASSFEVGGQAYLLELDLEKLLPFTTRLKKFSPMSRFPGMARDIALEIDKGVPARRVQDIIASFPLVSGVTAFDCYTGTGVPPGKKSLAFNIVYLSPERTLTEEEVNSIQDRILARLAQEVGAKLRGA